MAALSGWLALSTQPTIGQNAPFADAGYVCQAVSWSGSPLTNEQPRMPYLTTLRAWANSGEEKLEFRYLDNL
jgi:hypothetical protein